MSRKIIELVQVLVDRIEKNGYQQRAREENAFDLNKRLTEAEGWVAHWKQARQDAHEAGELMRAEIETLRQQLDAAQAAVTLQRAGIERLQAFVGKVRKVYSSAHPHNWMSLLRPALAELDAETTEPTPVAETVPSSEVERLRAFVEIMRGLLTAEYADQRIIAAAIAKLDDAGNSSVTLTSSPTPVAETLDAEGGA